LNALTYEQVLAIDKQLRIIRDDPHYRGALFIGAGDRAFCAGGDVLHIADVKLAKAQWNRQWFSSEFMLNHLISEFKKPVISLWKGIVMGGGVGLSIYGSHRIATDTTIFAMPETTIGFMPDIGASYFLSHYIHQRGLGLYLGMTGHRLNGADTVLCGLATQYIPTSKIDDFVGALEAAQGDELLDVIKKFNDPNPAKATLTPELLKSISEYFGNAEESFDEFFSRLKNGRDEFAKATISNIRTKCPLTVRVWYESFKLGAKQSLPEVLAREYSMCIQMTEVDPHNFREGVRAQ
jgi:enoyl-CoA hydratase/carnithine racemase